MLLDKKGLSAISAVYCIFWNFINFGELSQFYKPLLLVNPDLCGVIHSNCSLKVTGPNF
jgi:hypothetical protein